MKTRRWIPLSVLVGGLALFGLGAFAYRSLTKPRIVAEFYDRSDGAQIILVKRNVQLIWYKWDLRAEAYEGDLLIAMETILKNGESPSDFPKVHDARYDWRSNQLSVLFQGGVEITVELGLGESTLDDYIENSERSGD